MSDFLDALERELVDATRRSFPAASTATSGATERRRGAAGRHSLRTLLVTALVAGATATAGAAGTVLTLRGDVISPPAAEDVRPEQTAVPDSARVSALRSRDPARGEPPWTVRTARGRTGLVCSTVGQVRAGRFGLVGLDGRFRVLAPGVSDACGSPASGRASLLGARVLSGRTAADVRTVVNGLAPGVRSVHLSVAGRERRVPVDADGVFVMALTGYPEDLALRVRLTFAGGRTQDEALGAGDPSVTLDPERGPAWRVDGPVLSADRRRCVGFTLARAASDAPRSPKVCGRLETVDASRRTTRGAFFAVRRLRGDAPRPRGPRAMWSGDWNGAPARTAVWGLVGDDITAIDAQVAGDGSRRIAAAPGGAFLAVFPADVSPRAVRVTLTRRDGTTRTLRGDTDLLEPPTP